MFEKASLLMFIGLQLGSIGQLVSPEQATNGCLAEGTTVIYECAVNDTGHGSTVWQGNAFNCSDDQIVLNHSEYSRAGGVNGTCGDLFAESVAVNGSEYTSRLTVNVTEELDGKTFNCTLNETVDIGFVTIKVCMPLCDPAELISSDSTLDKTNDSAGTAAVPNGMISFTVSMAVQTCDHGCYSIGLSTTRMCMKNGSWSSGSLQGCACLNGNNAIWMTVLQIVGPPIPLVATIVGIVICCKCNCSRDKKKSNDQENPSSSTKEERETTIELRSTSPYDYYEPTKEEELEESFELPEGLSPDELQEVMDFISEIEDR